MESVFDSIRIALFAIGDVFMIYIVANLVIDMFSEEEKTND